MQCHSFQIIIPQVCLGKTTCLGLTIKSLHHFLNRLSLLLCLFHLGIQDVLIFTELTVSLLHVSCHLECIQDVIGLEDKHSLEI
jgi:hypothetical protein